MTPNFFLLSTALRSERLSWIQESLKFFFTQLCPETLAQQKTPPDPVFSFFLTADALYSLSDPELLQSWTSILSFPPVRIVFDRQELDRRGIDIGPLRIKFPDQVTEAGTGRDGNEFTFWRDLAVTSRQTKLPHPGTAGWFQIRGPCTDCSSLQGIRFLSAALEERLFIEMYAFLDGIYCGHQHQHPQNGDCAGKELVNLNNQAVAAGLTFHTLGCSRSATDRGYRTWDDGKGQVISTCTERVFRIRDISHITGRFREAHPILATDSGMLQMRRPGTGLTAERAELTGSAPPLIILVTRSPYGTSHTAGVISLAAAAAHAGILTRVIFMEDGVYAVSGNPRLEKGIPEFCAMELIHLLAGTENLHFFALTPSFQKRGIQKERSQNTVLDIGYPGLGKILFFPLPNVHADHQRVIVF